MRVSRQEWLALRMMRGRRVDDDRIARALGCTARGVKLKAEQGRRRFGGARADAAAEGVRP